jgi:hypothetical protein
MKRNLIISQGITSTPSNLKQLFEGKYYAWLESNLVYEVARYLAEIEVPELTVHDEFIVPEGMEDAVLKCRYTLGLDEVIYGED